MQSTANRLEMLRGVRAHDPDAFASVTQAFVGLAWRSAAVLAGPTAVASAVLRESFVRVCGGAQAPARNPLWAAGEPELELLGEVVTLGSNRRSPGAGLALDALGTRRADAPRPGAASTAGPVLVDDVLRTVLAAPPRARSFGWLSLVEGISAGDAGEISGITALSAARRVEAAIRLLVPGPVPDECRLVLAWLPAHVHGRLPLGVFARVHEHVAGCPDCRQREAALQQLAVRGRRLVPAIPDGLAEATRLAWDATFPDRGVRGLAANGAARGTALVAAAALAVTGGLTLSANSTPFTAPRAVGPAVTSTAPAVVAPDLQPAPAAPLAPAELAPVTAAVPAAVPPAPTRRARSGLLPAQRPALPGVAARTPTPPGSPGVPGSPGTPASPPSELVNITVGPVSVQAGPGIRVTLGV